MFALRQNYQFSILALAKEILNKIRKTRMLADFEIPMSKFTEANDAVF